MNFNKNIIVPAVVVVLLVILLIGWVSSRRNTPRPVVQNGVRFSLTPTITPTPTVKLSPTLTMTITPTVTEVSAKKLPKTGPSLLFPLFTTLGMGLVGFYLRKK